MKHSQLWLYLALIIFFPSARRVCSQDNSTLKNHKNADRVSVSGWWLTARTRNNSSTWLPRRRYTWEIRKSFSPQCATTQHEMVLFIGGRIRRDLLFLRLTGAAQFRPNFFLFFFFFCALQRKLKVHLFVTEDINIVWWQGEESGSVFFSGLFQVSVKATYMVIYKKRNLYFLLSLCVCVFFLCLLLQLRISAVQTEVGWGGVGW